MAPSPSRSRRLARIAVGMAALVALAGLGLCSRNSSGGGHGDGPIRQPAPPPVPAPAPVGPGPARPYVASSDGAVPSRDGAVAAAVAFVTNGQALLDMSPLEAEQRIREDAAADTVDAQVADLRRLWAGIHRALAGGRGPIRYWQAALASRVEAFTPQRAQVSVWHVGVLSSPGVAAPQSGWAVSLVDLVWERGGWKLERETVSAGPAPMLDASVAPASSEAFEAALAGFTRWDER